MIIMLLLLGAMSHNVGEISEKGSDQALNSDLKTALSPRPRRPLYRGAHRFVRFAFTHQGV
jgi:hypothetical protein